MRVHYLSPYCILRPTTNRIFDVRFCEGLVQNGCETELVYPFLWMKENIDRGRIAEFYGLTEPVQFTELKTPLRLGRLQSLQGWAIGAFMTHTSFRILREARHERETVVIGRSSSSLLPILSLRRAFPKGRSVKVLNLVSEVKSAPRHRRLYRQADGFITAASATAEDLAAENGVPAERIFNLLSPIPESLLGTPLDQRSAREALSLELSRPLVVYTGKLGTDGTGEEIRHILDAAGRLPRYRFLLTGGKADVVEHYRSYCRGAGIDNVSFSGFIDDSTKIRFYQAAADVLVSYYTPAGHSTSHNFPQKIGEYMAAGRAIVTPDFKATRDVLNDRNALFVPAMDTAALAHGIRRVVEDPVLATRLGVQARADVQALTFKKRIGRLLEFVRDLSPRQV